MSNIQDTEQLEDIEGVVESPQAHSKVFNSTKALGEWVALISPKTMQVQPTQDGKHLLHWRS